MEMAELGQDWKIAALRSSFHVHFFFGGYMNSIFFELAFSYAKQAFENDEVPVGAVIVKNGEVVSYGFNRKEHDCSVLSHAELIAIREAEKKIGNWRLDGCDMYVTLDPCPMCASAIKQSRISNVYSALSNSDLKNTDIISEILLSDKINPSVHFTTDNCPEESKKLLSAFFKKQRL